MKRQVQPMSEIKRVRQYVYFSSEHKEMLRYLAREKGVSVSKFISDVILDHVFSTTAFGSKKEGVK